MSISSFTRRALVAAAAGLALAACGNGNADSDTSAKPTAGKDGLVVYALGDENAPVTITEYASVTCGACYQFHKDVIPTLKGKYIAEGKVRFEFREFPTPPVPVAMAGFAIARCAGPDKYHAVIDDLFEHQPGILSAVRQGQAKPALAAVAARHGLDDAAFNACIDNPDVTREIADIVAAGDEAGVASTPTLFINGRLLQPSMESRTAEGLSRIIDAELGIEPEAETDAAPAETPEPAEQ